MIELDETGLVAFFGVQPQSQPSEEREFFAAPSFTRRVGDLEVVFSFSFHNADLYLTVRTPGVPDAVLQLHLSGIESLSTVSRDSARCWLRGFSPTDGTVELRLEPTISVRYEPSPPA